jgi:hypothetical protein
MLGEEDLPERLGFSDAWIAAGDSPDMATSDSLYKSRYGPRRVDRILFLTNIYNEVDTFEALEACLLGIQPIQAETPSGPVKVFLSDHKAVYAKLRVIHQPACHRACHTSPLSPPHVILDKQDGHEDYVTANCMKEGLPQIYGSVKRSRLLVIPKTICFRPVDSV